MIYPKKIQIPNVGRRAFVLTPAYLKKSDRVTSCRLLQFKEEGGAFVIADGSQFYGGVNSETGYRFFDAEGDLYIETVDGKLQNAQNGTTYSVAANCIVPYDGENGMQTYVVADGGVYRLGSTGYTRVTAMAGGKCAVIHHERLFVGGGSTIFYSAPLDAEDWSSADEAGTIPLTDVGGDILALLSHGNAIYVFREHRILRMKANANDLDFRFERIDFDGGRILGGTVQNCGEKIVFCTEEALMTLEGDTCKVVRKVRGDAALYTSALSGNLPHTCSYGGKYYAIVSFADVACILVYTPSDDSIYFIHTEATAISGGKNGVKFRLGNRIMQLSGRGMPVYGTGEAVLTAEMSIVKSNGEAQKLDAVTLQGKGNYTLTLTTEEGSVAAALSAGKRMQLPKVLKGSVLTLRLVGTSEDSVIRSLTLHIREEKQ